MKKQIHLRASAKPVRSALLLLREVAPKKMPDGDDHTRLVHKEFGQCCQVRRQQFPSRPSQSRPLDPARRIITSQSGNNSAVGQAYELFLGLWVT